MKNKEIVKIPVARFRDKTEERNPTCALEFSAGKYCVFLGSTRFGTNDVCLIGTDVTSWLRRRDLGMGSIIPAEDCMVWSKKERRGKR